MDMDEITRRIGVVKQNASASLMMNRECGSAYFEILNTGKLDAVDEILSFLKMTDKEYEQYLKEHRSPVGAEYDPETDDAIMHS